MLELGSIGYEGWGGFSGVNISVLIVNSGVRGWNDVGHTAIQVGNDVYGYYPTGSIYYSKGEMRVYSKPQFDKYYKGDGYTAFTLNIGQNQASNLETILNGYVSSPGNYSLFGNQCTSIACGSLLEAGVGLQDYHYNHGDPGPSSIETRFLSPNGFASILNLSINGSIVTGSSSYQGN